MNILSILSVVVLLPSAIEGQVSEVVIHLGDKETIGCHDNNKVTWYNSNLGVIPFCEENQNCTNVHQVPTHGDTTSELIFPKVKAEHEGIFSCNSIFTSKPVKQIATKVQASETLQYGDNLCTQMCSSNNSLRTQWYYNTETGKQHDVRECGNSGLTSFCQVEYQTNYSAELILPVVQFSDERMFICKDQAGEVLQQFNPKVTERSDTYDDVPFGKDMTFLCPIEGAIYADSKEQYSWEYLNSTSGSYELVQISSYVPGGNQWQTYKCDGISSQLVFFAKSSQSFRCKMSDNKAVWAINVTDSGTDFDNEVNVTEVFGNSLTSLCPTKGKPYDSEVQYQWQVKIDTAGIYEVVPVGFNETDGKLWQQYESDGIHTILGVIVTSNETYRCMGNDKVVKTLHVSTTSGTYTNNTCNDKENSSKAVAVAVVISVIITAVMCIIIAVARGRWSDVKEKFEEYKYRSIRIFIR